MTLIFRDGRHYVSADAFQRFVRDAGDRLEMEPRDVAAAAGANPDVLETGGEVGIEIYWPFARLAYEKRLIDLLPAHGIPSINYDLIEAIDLERGPIGLRADFNALKLKTRPKKICEHLVDFPIGVPASILTANASFLRYYAERGYCVLTYKTVRSVEHPGHPFPQWMCLEDPKAFEVDPSGALTLVPEFRGKLGYFPADIPHASMANSFGVPSLPPARWTEDVREARSFIRQGHQLLIVSVMSSVQTDLGSIQEDFARTVVESRDCGADVIELNFSCPNTPERAGLIYQKPADARTILEAVRQAVGGGAKVVTKIGYLNDEELRGYVEVVWDLIDGIVATNTMSAVVHDVSQPDQPAFPGRQNSAAGVSGWPIRAAAHHMAMSLVSLRGEIASREGKRLDVIGLGGVLTKADFDERLSTGVDAVEVCTGTYFNPMLGFECRNAQGRVDVALPNVRVVEGTDPESGVRSRSSPGAIRRARERSADVLDSPANRPIGRHGVRPDEARRALARYYAETSKAEKDAFRNAWMAELEDYIESHET